MATEQGKDGCDPKGKRMSNGTDRAFAGVLSIGMVCSFGWMLWSAQEKNLAFMAERNEIALSQIRKDVNTLADRVATPHPRVDEHLSSLEEKMQLVNIAIDEDDDRELVDVEREGRTIAAVKRAEAELESQRRFIRLLWRRVYDESLPNGHDKE